MHKVVDEKMFKDAIAVRARAHAPYSNFHVGAAILADNGEIYSGCNVENAAYPQGSCAEANAIGTMIAGGGKKIEAILVLAAASFDIFPCGGCRQRISEFAKSDTRIIIARPSGIIREVTFGELFPFSFDVDALESGA